MTNHRQRFVFNQLVTIRIKLSFGPDVLTVKCPLDLLGDEYVFIILPKLYFICAFFVIETSSGCVYLVQLFLVRQALQNAPVLPLSVLPAVEGCALLGRCRHEEALLRGQGGGPEAVGLLVAHFQEELLEFRGKSRGQRSPNENRKRANPQSLFPSNTPTPKVQETFTNIYNVKPHLQGHAE